MKIKSIRIQNFKSISDMEFKIKKYGGSYTRMLLGVNEVGKSNILEAMSFLNLPREQCDFNSYCTRGSKADVVRISLELEDDGRLKSEIMESIKMGKELLDFEFEYIRKEVCLRKGGGGHFAEEFDFKLKKLTDNTLVARGELSHDDDGQEIESFVLGDATDSRSQGRILSAINVVTQLELLTKKNWDGYFRNTTERALKKHTPKVSFWKPSDECLISGSIRLDEFKHEPDRSIPLRNIFNLAGYQGEEIADEIEKARQFEFRAGLKNRLQEVLNEYIRKVWKHDIYTEIEIDASRLFSLAVKDGDDPNNYNFYNMKKDRSAGFQQFISLILSLSIEAEKANRRNELILIDEPETHLHPASIRDLGKELLKIGKNNYLFVATHSPFLIDKKDKERNIIIKKNDRRETEKREIENDEDLRGDEVLLEAFGIDVYKDLLSEKRLLVEGRCDMKMIQATFSKLEINDIGITNGGGDHIVGTAKIFHSKEIDIWVLVDSDSAGERSKNKIIEMGGVFNQDNVFTLNDLVSELPDGATIEDCLDREFVTETAGKFLKTPPVLDEEKPCMEQIKAFLKEENKDSASEKSKQLKIELSNGVSGGKHELLEKLCKQLKAKLKPK